MRTRLAVAFALCVFLFGCMPGVTVTGDGNLVTENIAISDFERISLSGSRMVVNYVQSADQPSLTVTTDKNIFDLYEFAVESDKLVIKPKSNDKWVRFMPTEFTITANSSAISEVIAGGEARFNANSPIESDNLTIKFSGSGFANMPELVRVNSLRTDISGSGKIDAANLCVGEFKGNISGSGTLILGGEADQVDLSISGSGTVRAFELQSKTLGCSISGSGDIQMSVSEKIKARISGSGKIRYKGNPEIEKSVSGSGSVNRVD